MSVGANSYGSVPEVVALCRVYLHGADTFGADTLPTRIEVEAFINRASGVLNLALASSGFTIPVVQADAKFACDNWVVSMAKKYVEWSQPYAGLDDNPNAAAMPDLTKSAADFVKANQAGFAALGMGQPSSDSNAVSFTGETAQRDRSDPDDSSLEQPKFRRGQFDS